MKRMADRNDPDVSGVLAKLRKIEDVYRYSSFGETSPFVSTSEGRMVSDATLVDVIDRMFTSLPDDTLGLYYLDESDTMQQVVYSDGFLSGIGVDKAFLDSLPGSRILDYRCFGEIKKLMDAVQYVAIDTTKTRGNAYYIYDGAIVTTYDPDAWGFQINLNYGFFRLVLPGAFRTDRTWQGDYSHSIPSSWFDGVALPFPVRQEFISAKPYYSSGLKYYDNLGHDAPTAATKRHSLAHDDSKVMDLGGLFPAPFSWSKTVEPTDPFWTGGWKIDSLGAFVEL